MIRHEDLVLCKDSAHKKSKSTLAPPGLYTGSFQILAHGSARARFVIVPSPSTSRTLGKKLTREGCEGAKGRGEVEAVYKICGRAIKQKI